MIPCLLSLTKSGKIKSAYNIDDSKKPFFAYSFYDFAGKAAKNNR